MDKMGMLAVGGVLECVTEFIDIRGMYLKIERFNGKWVVYIGARETVAGVTTENIALDYALHTAMKTFKEMT